MEEWEDELQERLNEILEEYTDRGLTSRQVLGILETLKFEIIINLSEVEFEPEEE